MPSELNEARAAVPLVALDRPTRRIGYLVNCSFHIWYQMLISIMEARAQQYGPKLVACDAELSAAIQVKRGKGLTKLGVEAFILTPATIRDVKPVLAVVAERRIPILLEGNLIEGLSTSVATCDYDAGHKLGRSVGDYVSRNSPATPFVLDVALPNLHLYLMRSEGFMAGLREVIPNAKLAARVDGQAAPKTAHHQTAAALCQHPEVNMIFAMDDGSVQGAIAAYLDGRYQDSVVVVGFGVSGDHEKDQRMARGPLKASAAS